MSIFIKGLNRLIKGMKMPKLEKTYKVRLYKAVDGRIIVTACGIKDNLFQPVGEVIEVLTPHGRLIDADELSKQKYENIWTNRLVINADDLDDAHIVIEAED